MTNLNIIQETFPIGTKVEVISNRILCFEGEVVDYIIDDFNPECIVVNKKNGEKRLYSHNTMAKHTV